MATKPKGDEARLCFVIMPFNRKSDLARGDRVDFDRVYRRLIKPAVESLEKRGIAIRCLRSDEVQQAGLIQERMLRYIYEADVAVVDLTTANPNVYYELGVRHALRDRVTVLLRRRKTQIPFNIAGMTTIEYDLDPAAMARAKLDIAAFVQNGLFSGARDSLVHTVLRGLKVERGAAMIAEGEVETFAVPESGGRTIGIVSGNLRNVNMFGELVEHPIDVWVNSENINMQMARPYERSVSAMIRYLGAEHDRSSAIVRDLVADELAAAMAGRQVVNPGEVVATGAGRLQRSHRVKRIYHVASVYGVVGTGFHSIATPEQCITNALARLDWEAHEGAEPAAGGAEATPGLELESILFPLLGGGTARADQLSAARKLVEAAIAYLRSRAQWTRVRRVFFLAPDELTRDCLRVAIAEQLKRLAGRSGNSARRGPTPVPTVKTTPSRPPAASAAAASPARGGARRPPAKARRRRR
jgi:O-acetyl-ADP-ribose deacetylase (regulator of RNase III)